MIADTEQNGNLVLIALVCLPVLLHRNTDKWREQRKETCCLSSKTLTITFIIDYTICVALYRVERSHVDVEGRRVYRKKENINATFVCGPFCHSTPGTNGRRAVDDFKAIK